MNRVADYTASFLEQLGIQHIFLVSGGGMMFLSDGLALNPKIRVICNHHEQACAMAGVAYAKQRNDYGAVYVTTGCGGTNALTGLLGAWQDHVPCIFISGQTKRKETIRNSGLALRQFGVQEADILSVAAPLTKYAAMVNEPEDISYHLEKAAFLAKDGRPGPVWIDIPLDVQGAQILEDDLKHFTPEEQAQTTARPVLAHKTIMPAADALRQAARPVIVAGHGVRLGNAIEELRQFIEREQIPVVASRLGIDLLASDHPLFIGRIGNKGTRAGNFAVQNADCVLVLGSRLSVSSTGHEYHTFAREAKIIVVDIDTVEHQKNTVKIDHFVHAHVRDFLQGLLSLERLSPATSWPQTCLTWKMQWPVCLPEYIDRSQGVNLYYFIDELSRKMDAEDTIISDAGSSFYVVSQGVQLKPGQRYVTSAAQAEMGFTLPAAVGVAMAKERGNAVGVTGDGSLQMNLQELQTLVHYQLPVKLFVWNNNGYLSIRATQRKFFDSRFIGTDAASGVSFPDLEKICAAYSLPFYRVNNSKELPGVIKDVLAQDGPVVCEVMCIADQEIIPSVASFRREDGSMISKPLEDMYPFLPREEFLKNMIITPLNEDSNE